MYAEELATLTPASPLSNSMNAIQVLRPLTPAHFPTIEPLLEGVCWGQTEPYNNLCPLVSGYKTPTGCVATAIAQIMYKHQYPVQGKGSHSYKTNSYKLSLSADFGATVYDWANMLPDYTGAYSEEQATAVATLTGQYSTGKSQSSSPSLKPKGSGAGRSQREDMAIFVPAAPDFSNAHMISIT